METPLTNGVHHPATTTNNNNTTTPPTEKRRWIVQKFGGTSVGKFAETIVEDVIKPASSRNRIAVVCSARSASTKTDGTTNCLLRAAREAEKSGSSQHGAIVKALCHDHKEAAKALINSEEIWEEYVKDLQDDCVDLSLFLEAANKIGEVSSRSRDKIISKGEKLSCRLMTALLRDRGAQAQLVDLSEIINFDVSRHGLDQLFYQRLAMEMARAVRDCGDKIPVITGYFGVVPGGLLDQIGRGYTDLCAALVAIGLEAQELQVWKEVDGIFTADPRRVPTARLLSTIAPAEAAELTFYGSEVIHPFTMEQVIRAQIPIRIKNVMNPLGNGTVIDPERPSSSSNSEKTGPGSPRPKRPTAITIKRNILVLNVHSNQRTLSHGFFAKIFSVLDHWRLSVDLISTSEVHVSMAIHSEAAWRGGGGQDEVELVDHDLKSAINELCQYGRVDIIPDMAILSLVGTQMKRMIGIAGRMFTTLGEHCVNIEMISQGASEINISCVIEERDADRAINILHTNLFTFLD
ncbi:MAG: Aspartokinase [Peltula sp. TS41687]|nr:MAG: Aspartokinase [Peltula sp. TS41687]